uniref:Bifunctional inhibitor/plant lipid transfer protein/seed storage helical domain-containing protein n=1 Tax=Setaria italica TaxID=4555 RepID=K3Y9M2_SETIT
MSSCIIVVVLAVAAAVMAAARPSEAARYTAAPAASSDADADALRFPGRPGSSRPRSPIFPGFPGARPSPPTSSSGTPSSRSSPAPVSGGVPSAPPCPRPAAPSVSGFPFVPGFPGLPGGGVGGSTPSSSPTECVTPLAALMTCGSFLTGSEQDTPTPQSECCSGLGAFLNTTAAAGDGDRTLRCLCPVILGDVNKMLPKPLDPVRMMYLPIACGVVLPPQVLYICFTGQQTPPLVGRIPDVWEKPSAASE